MLKLSEYPRKDIPHAGYSPRQSHRHPERTRTETAAPDRRPGRRVRAAAQALSDEQLRAKTAEFRERLAKGETLDDLLAEASRSSARPAGAC